MRDYLQEAVIQWTVRGSCEPEVQVHPAANFQSLPTHMLP